MYKINNLDAYTEVIYSGGAKHRPIIKFNGVALEDPLRVVEYIKVTRKILANGDNRFSLDNFMSTSVELVLHNTDISKIQNPVELTIGTLVGENYVDVPIGIFEIQDSPTTDKNKITIKLNDYATKFDIPYNAQPLLEENDGKATLRQILDDICIKCGVENKITHFDNEDIVIGLYDNTINARQYISYIAEQAGNIAIIDRDGKLIFVDLNTDGTNTKDGTNIVINSEINRAMIISLHGKTVQESTPSSTVPQNITNITGEIQITKNTETITLNLGNNQLCATTTETVHDDLIIDKNGNVDIEKKIKQIVLDGTENWKIATNAPNQDNTIYLETNDYDGIYNSNEVISNYFKYKSRLWVLDEEGIYYDKTNEYSIRIRIDKTIASTVDEFKTWLNTHNVIIQGEAITTETVHVDTIEPLKTIIGENNVSNNVNAMMSVTYYLKRQPYEIPINIVESFVDNKSYKIGRVEYEDAIRKFEQGSIDDCLYLNTANPYITNQEQINNILEKLRGYEIHAFETGKVIMNPLLDPYDLIKFEWEGKEYKTLAQYEFNYNGVITGNYQTQIGEKEKESNVTINSEEAKFKRAYTRIDEVEGKVEIVTSETANIKEDLTNNYYQKTYVNQLIQTAEQGVTNTFSEAGGNNIFRNTGLWYENDEYNVDNSYISKNLGDLLCTLNNRQYTKTYNGLAYVSYYYDGEYTYPLLIGFTPESVVYTALDTRLDQYTTTKYNNITYYVSATIFAMGGNWTSTEGKANKLSEEAITREEAISIMLSKIGNFSPYEFWNGNVIKTSNSKSANSYSFVLQEGILSQEQEVSNGNYTASFKYKKLIELANVKVKINDIEYNLNELTDTEFVTGQTNNNGEYITQPLVVSSQHINIQFISDTNNACEIYDIMVNAGTVKLAYSQNQNETTTDTVNISKGITITSSTTSTTFKANARGIKTIDKNNNTLTEFTDTGMTTKEQVVKNKAQICNVLIQPIGNQTWFTKI